LSQPYSVEDGIADLRPYLARLQRALRCFSGRFKVPARVIELFVYFCNHRQHGKRRLPEYPAQNLSKHI
jgi:hypothetical protein